ncbi:MAG: hypothetical protein JRE45_05305 [Deltaproteobacteria bacterium]|nr:hypothetical protein [Deltaproteobacteria bacterium]
MKYGWIAFVVMMATLLSTGQVAAQDAAADAAAEGAEAEAPASELDKLKAMEEEAETPTVVGARPVSASTPAKVGEAGMGTEASERERMYGEQLGAVGKSVRQKGDEAVPLKFKFHGYYRARYNWIGNAPMPKGSIPGAQSAFPSKNASYGYMRLRLDPEVTYGPNPDLPIARLRFTIDGLDNVVFGDNARVFSSNLFSVDQSKTTVDGFDLTESLKLERAWIEFLVPIGQVRVGRMESHWGMGTLTHAGNGLAEWGDFMRGETFDRILFATRPITLARGISKGDTRSTPLIYAFLYDRLTQDPVLDSTIASPPVASQTNFEPFYTTFDERSTFPLAYLTNLDRRVNEIANVLAWHDEEFGHGATDEFFLGTYVVYRWQQSTESRIIIPDVAWRLKYTLKNNRNLAITTEGEYYTILGHSGALAFTGGCPPEPCTRGNANIHNILARVGVMDEGNWAAQLEGGWARGDADTLSFTEQPANLTTRGFNENVKVGLLMYQVALKALGYSALSPVGATALGPNGSVYNSTYFMPSYRFTVVSGLELHAQFLVAWVDKLDPLIYQASNTACGFSSECFMGWEADLALRAKMGAKDIVWIDLETGLMQPKQAFINAGFNDAFLWTVQLRAAMIF